MIDRKITFALILALIVESAGVLALAGGTGERLKEFEPRPVSQSAMAERLARFEVKRELAATRMTRIEQTLEALQMQSLVIEGNASLFGVEDMAGDVVPAGVFLQSLARNDGLGMLLSHVGGRTAGRWTTMREDGRGLFVRAFA